MAEKLDYTIQIDEQQYDITAADSLHADLANQVEEALIVKKSVRKSSIDAIKDNESLVIGDLKDAIEDPSTAVGVNDDGTPIDRTATNAFAFKGDSEAEIEVVPSSGGVFTGPIYAPDIDADDGFNINKFQVTNYNSVDTIIRELHGFPVYEWTGTQVRALTEGTPPTMLPFKVIIYTGPTSGDTDYWTTTARANLRLVNCAPDGTTTDCTTDGNFFLINAKAGHLDCGRILLGTFDHTKTTNCSTYVELRVKEADHADNATNVTDSIGNISLDDIFVYKDSDITSTVQNAEVADRLGTANKGSQTKPIYLKEGIATECCERAGGTAVTLNGEKNYDNGEAESPTTSVSFYAPTEAGENGQVLLSNGGETDKTPTWASQDSLSVENAKNVTESIKGQPITNIFEKSDAGISTIVKKATTAEQAEQANTLYIYSVGGIKSTENNITGYFADKNASYILYGSNEPPTTTSNNKPSNLPTGLPEDSCLWQEGNIYIKIES